MAGSRDERGGEKREALGNSHLDAKHQRHAPLVSDGGVMNPEEQPDFDEIDEDRDSCVACGTSAATHDLATCDGCGNAVCRACGDEDDFGNTACTPGCGSP